MNSIKYITLTVTALIMAGFLVVIWVLAQDFLTMREQEIRNRAYETCAQSASYTRAVKDGTVTTPVDDVYRQCLRDKGYL